MLRILSAASGTLGKPCRHLIMGNGVKAAALKVRRKRGPKRGLSAALAAS